MNAGHNGIVGAAEPFVDNIEELTAEIDEIKSEMMLRCKAKKALIKDVFGKAKDAGVARTPLKAIITRRRLERKIERIADDFDIDETATYQALVEGLGALGEVAAVKAGYGEKLKAAERARNASEANIGLVGRGPPDPIDKITAS